MAAGQINFDGWLIRAISATQKLETSSESI